MTEIKFTHPFYMNVYLYRDREGKEEWHRASDRYIGSYSYKDAVKLRNEFKVHKNEYDPIGAPNRIRFITIRIDGGHLDARHKEREA